MPEHEHSPPLRPQDYDFELPPELVAQHPAARRPDARMLVLDDDGSTTDTTVASLLEHIPAEALVVLNESKVVPARVHALREDGRVFELLFVDPDPQAGEGAEVRAWVRQAKKLSVGTRLTLEGGEGPCELELRGPDPIDPRARRFLVRAGRPFSSLMASGEVPLPPYIRRDAGPTAADLERYQTVYANAAGSVAAPTAGLHLDAALLDALGDRVCRLTLHVGPGTFLPMEADDVRDHRVGSERIRLDATTASRINEARAQGRPVVAVGTTVVRTLESIAARFGGELAPFEGTTDLVIVPGHRFAAVDWLMTNFHLPKSSLLMLTATFGGRERVLAAYRAAVASGYRFYSYGDCMLLPRAGD